MKQPSWSGGLGRINTEIGGVRDLTEITRERQRRRKRRSENVGKDSDPENWGHGNTRRRQRH